MNRFVKVTVLTLLALATAATTIQFADAGERYWREHRPWHKRTVIVGVNPGVVVTRPRVIVREAPVVVDEGPVYDRETLYEDDDDNVYADPDRDYGRRVYRENVPDPDDYAAPRDYDDNDDQAYDNRPATEDDYFPDRPQSRVERREVETLGKQAVIETAPRKQTRKTSTVKQTEASDLKPWTKEWKAYCADRFSTFNPQNGTYLGYDQKRHFCKAG